MKHPAYYTVVVFAAFTAASWIMFASAPSPDLRATWIAGHFFSLGMQDQVYAGNTAYFTMLPSQSWQSYLDGIGHDGAAYPFVYPPLWAAVAAWIVPHVPFEAAKAVAQIANPLLMVGMVWRASRMVRDSDVSVPMMCLVGAVALLLSLPGGAALEQNQPQILVSFLLVAAIERARAGAPLTAGAALALAASIKLYPALLVVAWIAGGRWRETGAFAVAGVALGGASVWLAGWPMHAAFLAEIDTIRQSVIITYFTYGIDPIIAYWFFPDDLHRVTALGGEGARSYLVLQKPALWTMISSVALVTILALTAWWFRTRSRDGEPADVLAWPILLIALTFVSPLAWGYHYLPALAFLPHLLDRFGLRHGLVMILLAVAPLTLQALELALRAPPGANLPVLIGSFAMLGLAALYAVSIRLRGHQPERPLHAPPVSL